MAGSEVSPVRRRNRAKGGAGHFAQEWLGLVLGFLFCTSTLLATYLVPTGSMEPTILVGDHMIVDRLAYSPAGAISKHLLPYRDVRRGDVIVFRSPADLKLDLVKRVIGVPGDHLRLRDKVLYLNGKRTDERYARHIDPRLEPYRDTFPAPPAGPVDERGLRMLRDHVVNGEIVVPPGQYFALGDNRDNSLDSRYWGFVPRDNIVGKPLVIFWSYDAPTDDLLGYSARHIVDLALNFFTKTRWDRTLRLVRAELVE